MSIVIPAKVRPYRPSDPLIQARRRDDDKRQKLLEHTAYYRETENRSLFETYTADKIVRRHISKRYDDLRRNEQARLEERRERLRNLFEIEDNMYRRELAALEETEEMRINRMKSKAQDYRERRERERLELVQEKERQKLRLNSHEIRQHESKELEKAVYGIRELQLDERKRQQQREEDEKAYFHNLWEQDRLKKVEKEEAEQRRRREMNTEMATILQEQIQLLQAARAQEEAMKSEEGRLWREAVALQQQEADRQERVRLETQRAIRNELDYFNKLKMRQQAAEFRENLEKDIRLLEQIIQADEEEKLERIKLKAQLHREAVQYYQHLKEQKALEIKREKEMERLLKEDEERVWRRRAEEWKKERLAREKLLREVVEGRRLQIEENQRRVAKRSEEIAKERAMLEEQVRILSAQEEAWKQEKAKAINDYRHQLLEQVAWQEVQRHNERQLKRLEEHRAAEVEVAYDKVIREEIRNQPISKFHGRTNAII